MSSDEFLLPFCFCSLVLFFGIVLWLIHFYKIIFSELKLLFLHSNYCQEPVWGTPPMAKVMRKEARHMQRLDRASGVPLEILKHLPPKPESAYFTALCSHLHLWLYEGLSWVGQECFSSQPWEAWDVLNCLNTDSFEQLKDWLEIVLVKVFHLSGQCLLLSLHIPYLLCPWQCID